MTFCQSIPLSVRPSICQSFCPSIHPVRPSHISQILQKWRPIDYERTGNPYPLHFSSFIHSFIHSFIYSLIRCFIYSSFIQFINWHAILFGSTLIWSLVIYPHPSPPPPPPTPLPTPPPPTTTPLSLPPIPPGMKLSLGKWFENAIDSVNLI